MNNKTYRTETFEWENIWWEQTENENAKRVTYIGDSISCGVRGRATEVSENEILFDGFASSKALDNPYFQRSLENFFAQRNGSNAILFNNGLHGWHLSIDAYEKYYRKMLDFLKSVSAAPIFLLLTTDVLYDENQRKILRQRNETVRKIAADYNVSVIDLFEASLCNADRHTDDGVHYTDEGYYGLARFLVASLTDKI